MLTIPFYGTIIYGWIGKNRRHFWLWCAILLIVMAPLTTLEYADFDNYSRAFEKIGIGDYAAISSEEISIGWLVINKIFYLLGFSYRGLISSVIILCFYLIHKVVSKYKLKESVFWSLFLVFPAFIQCVQIRFFLATVICVYAFEIIIEEKRHCMMKYAALVLFSSLIHTASLILLLYLCIPLIEKYSKKKALFITGLIAVAVYFSLSAVERLAQMFVPAVRYSRYFGQYADKTSFSRYVSVTLIWILSYFVSYIIKRYLGKREISIWGGKDTKIEGCTDRIFLYIALAGATIPFLTMDSSFHRFFEVSYLFMYILIASFWIFLRRSIGKKIIMIALFSMLVFSMTRIYITYDTILVPFFSVDGFFHLFRWL